MRFINRRLSCISPQRWSVGVKGGVAALAVAAVLAGCSAPTSQQAEAPAAVAAQAGTPEPDITDAQHRLRLISQAQYFNTIASMFGSDVLPNVSFAPFQRTEGLLATGAAYEGVTESQIELYQRAASVVSDTIVSPERRDFIIPCKPANEKAADTACATRFLGYVGQRLFRRPLEAQKLQEVVAEADRGAARLEDFYGGLSLALEGLMLSPKALYFAELAEPDPKNPGQLRLDSYSLASRLSFFLWNQAPDDDLLKAAASGELHTEKGRARVVDAMLASPKLETGVRAFFDDMLGFDAFATLAKDAAVYPNFTASALSDAREQTLRLLVNHLVTNKGDYRDIFTTRELFVSKSLAPLYRRPTPRSWVRYESPPDSPQAGFLTQVSFLAQHSHPGRSSPTLRGKALRELLMCQPVPKPPANVDFSAIENPDPRLRTARDRLNFHSENPVCAGCHKITDPMGLALEHFDGAGQYRDTEKGAPIDASGTLDGKPFKDAVGLGQAMHDHPAVPACLVRRVYAYGMGGRPRREDQPLIAYFNERFSDGGYQLPALMRMVALSKSFAEVVKNEDVPAAPEKTATAAPQTASAN